VGPIDAHGHGDHSGALGLAEALAVGGKSSVTRVLCSGEADAWVPRVSDSLPSFSFISNSRILPYLVKIIS